MLGRWSRLGAVGAAAIGGAAALTRADQPRQIVHAQATPTPTVRQATPATTTAASSPSGPALLLHAPTDPPSAGETLVSDQELTPEQRQQCEAWKDKAITDSRKVDYLFRAMGRLGCVVDPRAFISCVHCPAHASGAAHIHDDMTHVLMSANGIRSYDQFETVLTHELIHVFDHCKYELDTTNVRHHACTEVRASNLSGDCSFKRELMRGDTDITAHQPKCVKRRAIMSILTNPQITSVDQARKIVDEVYDRCAADTEPFGSVPW